MAVQPKPQRDLRLRRSARKGSKEGLGLWQIAWRRLRRNYRAMLGLYVILFLGTCAIFAPQVATHDPDRPQPAIAEQAPSREHWVGTDNIGRDVYSRLVYGGRISLTVGVVVVGMNLVIGVFLGAIAGFYGGVVDGLIMRFTDIIMTIPFFPLALTMAAVLGPSFSNTMIILGILGWTGICRLVRGEFLSLRKRDFVEAAVACGAQDGRVIFRHILPNAMAPIMVAATLGVAGAIIGEAGLSFLGLGVPQPTPSWGNMLQDAVSLRVLMLHPWLWIPPGMLIFISVLAVNLLGDGLRDALDPRLKV